ncbi:MAG: amidohydrolase family protein [Gammaproteobacteria bacterium]
MYKFFSVDDHIIEHGRVWTDRMPAKFKAVAPHVVEADGREYWEYEDRRHPTMGLNAVAGTPRETWAMDPKRFQDMHPACYDPKKRAEVMYSQGIYASVNFPSLPGFGGHFFSTFKDKELASACVSAWNDFLIDEWCGAAPDLFVPMVICQTWDPKLAAEEIRRCLGKGAKALCFLEDPHDAGLPGWHTDHWDPILALCQEAKMPICMHIGGAGDPSRQLDPATPALVSIAVAFTQSARCAVNMMVSPVCEKFPDIKLVWSEGGIGWIPAAIERADRQWERHAAWSWTPKLRPSDIAKRNMWFCMIEEPVGLQYRHDFNVEHIVWESDFPHADTPYPETQKNADEVFKGVPADEVEKITWRNAEKLFNWKMTVPA